MTIETHGHTFVFLCICLLVTAADQDCSLTSYTPISGCKCLNFSLACHGVGDNQTLPSELQILTDVEVLTITGYKISELNTSSMFGIQEHLVKLDLSNNKIENITSDSFSGKTFPKLEILSLEGNHWNITVNATANTHIFEGLLSLQELNLRKALTYHFFRGGHFSNIFRGSELRNLTKLDLSGNDIRMLDPDIFNYTNKLEEVDLSDCNLTQILEGLFTTTKLPNLQRLDLSNNNLTVVEKYVVEDLLKNLENNVTKVNMTGNPLICICNSIRFITWLQNNTSLITDGELFTCHNKPFIGTRMVKVNVSEITCPAENGLTFQYVILCIIFGILGLLALIILFMRRNDILRFCMQVRQATKDAFDSHQTHYTYSGIQNAKRVTPDSSGEASV